MGETHFHLREPQSEGDTALPPASPLKCLAPHERLPEVLVMPREKTPTGAAACIVRVVEVGEERRDLCCGVKQPSLGRGLLESLVHIL